MTNTFKEDVAIGVASSIERSLAAAASSLMTSREQAIGARGAFRLGQERLRGLSAHADALLEEGALNPDERAAWKRALQLADGALESLFQTTDVSVHELDGQIKAFNTALTIATKQKTAYHVARQAILEHESAEEEHDEDKERGAPQGTKALRTRDLDESEKQDPEESEDVDVAAMPAVATEEFNHLMENNTRLELQNIARKLGLPISGAKHVIAQKILYARGVR